MRPLRDKCRLRASRQSREWMNDRICRLTRIDSFVTLELIVCNPSPKEAGFLLPSLICEGKQNFKELNLWRCGGKGIFLPLGSHLDLLVIQTLQAGRKGLNNQEVEMTLNCFISYRFGLFGPLQRISLTFALEKIR